MPQLTNILAKDGERRPRRPRRPGTTRPVGGRPEELDLTSGQIVLRVMARARQLSDDGIELQVELEAARTNAMHARARGDYEALERFLLDEAAAAIRVAQIAGRAAPRRHVA